MFARSLFMSNFALHFEVKADAKPLNFINI